MLLEVEMSGVTEGLVSPMLRQFAPASAYTVFKANNLVSQTLSCLEEAGKSKYVCVLSGYFCYIYPNAVSFSSERK